MNVWLCPVKPRSWRVIKRVGLFGFPKSAKITKDKPESGDLLMFYVLKPVRGIVSIAKVTSMVFEDHTDIWGHDKYPFRVKIDLLLDFSTRGRKPFPLSVLFGGTTNPDITIEPFLKDVYVTRVDQKQYKRLRIHLKNCESLLLPE